MRLLLLSNSTNYGEEYLGYPRSAIKDFLGNFLGSVLFIPYAGVTISYDDYTQRVGDVYKELGYELSGIHSYTDPIKAIMEAEAIAMGGGNTFELLNQLYKNELIEPIKMRVHSGMPFMGWSAGSNMACPTMMTTNDMPIAEPPSFVSLDLISFQINPHYTEATIPGHGGESRNVRIEEYLLKNNDSIVVGLPEGMIIRIEGDHYQLIGDKGARIFQFGKEASWVYTDEEFNRSIRNS